MKYDLCRVEMAPHKCVLNESLDPLAPVLVPQWSFTKLGHDYHVIESDATSDQDINSCPRKAKEISSDEKTRVYPTHAARPCSCLLVFDSIPRRFPFAISYRPSWRARVGLGFRTAQAKIQTPLLFTIACLVSNLTIDGRVSYMRYRDVTGGF